MLQGYLTSYFELACVLWTCAIAFTLHHSVLLRKDLHRVSRWLPRYALFCQGLPAAACLVVHAFDAFGEAGAWCWIRAGGTRNDLLRFATFYAPCWVAILYNTAVYARVRLAVTAPRGAVAPSALPLRPAATDPLHSFTRSSSHRPRSLHAGERGWIFAESDSPSVHAVGSAGCEGAAGDPLARSCAGGVGRGWPRSASAAGSRFDGDEDEEEEDGAGVIEEPPEWGPHRALTEVARMRQERARQLSRRLIMYPVILAVVRG